MKQTYIIKTWGGGSFDFYRVSCKKVDTCIKYLKGWKQQAKEKGYTYIFRNLLADDAHYKIIATPDGYNETETVASGLMLDL